MGNAGGYALLGVVHQWLSVLPEATASARRQSLGVKVTQTWPLSLLFLFVARSDFTPQRAAGHRWIPDRNPR